MKKGRKINSGEGTYDFVCTLSIFLENTSGFLSEVKKKVRGKICQMPKLCDSSKNKIVWYLFRVKGKHSYESRVRCIMTDNVPFDLSAIMKTSFAIPDRDETGGEQLSARESRRHIQINNVYRLCNLVSDTISAAVPFVLTSRDV